MKHLRLKRLLGLVLVGCFSILHVPIVFAAAGDTIGNTASLSFTVNSGPALILESAPGAGNTVLGATFGTSTDFTEDRLINFTVAEDNGITTSVSPSATLQVQAFTVTNNGNGPQDFIFAALNQANGTADPFGGVNDNFDATAVQVFVDSAPDNSGGADAYVAATDTGIFMDELAPGVTRTVYIVATIPNAATVSNGDLAVLTLVAQVATGGAAAANETAAGNAGAAITNDDNGNTSPAGTYSNGATAVAAGTANDVADIATGAGSEQIVFNDPAGATATDEDSTGAAQDVVQNGQHSDSGSYTVGAAELTVAKTSVALWDPVNGNSNPKAIPGGYVQYTITISNAGTAGASGDLTTLTDTLQSAGVGFGAAALDPDLIDGTAVPPAAAGAPENAAGDGIRIDTSGTGRDPTLNASNSDINYCTGDDAADTDADGCSYTGGAGGTVGITFASLESMDAEATGAGYLDGELKPGESVVIVFNVIVQ